MWLSFVVLAAASAAQISFDQAVVEALADAPGSVIVDAARDRSFGIAQRTANPLDNPEIEVERTGSETELRASLSIPLTGQPVMQWKLAAALRREALALGQQGRADLAAAVGGAYLDVVRAEELAVLFDAIVEDTVRVRDATVRLAEAGETSAVDRAVTESLTADAIAEAAGARQDLIVARMRLEALLGREPVGAIDAAGWPELSIPERIDAAELPSVVAANEAARQAQAEWTLAVVDTIPTPAVTVGQRIDAEKAWIYGVALEVPIFAPGIGDVRAARAEARLRAAAADFTLLDAEADVGAARAELDAALAAWQAVSSVSGLDAALADVNRALEIGEYSITDYATRREHLLRARTVQVQARYRLESARLELWRIAGTVPEVRR